tara:strand:+ start:409 stop:675 length:267 start_codon:yes stop_codon:yes gene_type:complete
MTEFTAGIFQASKKIYIDNKGSILRTLVYTLGHFVIAIVVLKSVADVTITEAMTDAVVEPLANSVWYFVLDKFWTSKVTKKKEYKRKI